LVAPYHLRLDTGLVLAATYAHALPRAPARPAPAFRFCLGTFLYALRYLLPLCLPHAHAARTHTTFTRRTRGRNALQHACRVACLTPCATFRGFLLPLGSSHLPAFTTRVYTPPRICSAFLFFSISAFVLSYGSYLPPAFCLPAQHAFCGSPLPTPYTRIAAATLAHAAVPLRAPRHPTPDPAPPPHTLHARTYHHLTRLAWHLTYGSAFLRYAHATPTGTPLRLRDTRCATRARVRAPAPRRAYARTFWLRALRATVRIAPAVRGLPRVCARCACRATAPTPSGVPRHTRRPLYCRGFTVYRLPCLYAGVLRTLRHTLPVTRCPLPALIPLAVITRCRFTARCTVTRSRRAVRARTTRLPYRCRIACPPSPLTGMRLDYHRTARLLLPLLVATLRLPRAFLPCGSL